MGYMASSRLNLLAPMLVPAVGLAVGIIADNIGASPLEGCLCILTGVALYLVALWMIKDPLLGYKYRNIHAVWVFIIFAGIGILASGFTRPVDLLRYRSAGYSHARGYIRDISHKTYGDRALVEITEVYGNASGTKHIPSTKALIDSEIIDAEVDDYIIFPYNISRIEDSPNSFSSGYADFMAHKGICYSIFSDPEDIKVAGHTLSLTGISREIRDNIEIVIEKSSLNRETRYFLITVLLGDRAYMDTELRSLFSDAGVSHVLALSGLHISIIAGILLWLLFPLNFSGLYRVRLYVTLPLLWGYAFVTGLSPSAVRACIMTSCLIICMLLERKNSAWNSLLFAAFMILLFSPGALYDIGFQLSFVGVASLVLFAGPLNPVEKREHKAAYTVVGAILVSLIASAATWIIVAYYFHIFPLLFLPANLIILPCLPFYLVAAILYLAFSSFGIAVSPLGYLLDSSFSILTDILRFINGSSQSVLNITVPYPSLWLWLSALVMMALFIHKWRKRWLAVSASVVGIVAVVAIPLRADEPDGFIIQDRISAPSVMYREKGVVSEVSCKVNAVTEHIFHDRRIVFADCPVDRVSYPHRCDYLIITRSCTSSIETLDSVFHPGRIIVHPSVRRKREKALSGKADSLGIRLHSLRNDGPYHYSYDLERNLLY